MATIGGPSEIKTLTDLELDVMGVPRGSDAAGQVAALQDSRVGTPGGGTIGRARAQEAAGAGSVPWAMMQQRNAAWDGAFWEECRALYAGGKRLFGNPDVLKRLFPSNPYESPKIYQARMARAHYFPYAGTIIDSLLAGLASDPLRIAFGEINPKDGQLKPAEDADWWSAFVEDVTDESSVFDDEDGSDDNDDKTATGGLPMHQFLTEVLRDCQQTGHSWVQIDMPAPSDATVIDSKLAEQRANTPYLCLVPAETVIDWEYDENDKARLLWVLTLEKSTPRMNIREKRGAKVHHKYTLWTETDWEVFEIDVTPGNKPTDDQPVRSTAFGVHSFGCVPFCCVKLPEGLWAMGKLHSLSREHLNKRCAMSWAEYKALFPILYEFLDESATGGEIPQIDDTDRAVSQVRGQGFTQQRRGGDRVEFIGPDVAPFKEARETCNDTMREMHRVMHSMALSADMGKAALSRSGDSKEEDASSTQVVLGALGLIMRRICSVLLAFVARGRGEDIPPVIISGLDHFDTTGVTEAIADAVQVFSAIPISKSKTAYSFYLANLLRKVCGNGFTDGQAEQMREEISDALAQEELMMDAMAQGATAATGDDPKDDDADRPKDDEDGAPTPPRVGLMKSKPMK